MTALPNLRTLEEFLDWERRQPERYEFLDGVVKLMTGGSLDHSAIQRNLLRQLGNRLEGSPCQPFTSDAKVLAAGRSFYPDASVTCSAITDGKSDIVPDPVVVFEVASPTSARDDQGRKKLRYFRIASLRHYVIVDQDEALVQLYSRDGQQWTNLGFEGLEAVLELPAIGVSIPLAAIYEGTSVAA